MVVAISATAQPSLVDLLEVFGAVAIGGVLGRLLALIVLRCQRSESPVAAGGRAPRGDRASRPAVSPAAGGPAAEVASPDVHASAVEDTQR